VSTTGGTNTPQLGSSLRIIFILARDRVDGEMAAIRTPTMKIARKKKKTRSKDVPNLGKKM
jgi:hypothetical protein